MTDSKNMPLAYFDKLLQFNNYRFLKDSAVNSFVERLGSMVKSVDKEKGIVQYIGIFSNGSPEPIEAIAIYSFETEFYNEVIQEAGKVIQNIDSLVLEINKNGNSANQFLISQVKHLNNLVEKAKTIYPKLYFIEQTIQKLITYFVDRYSLKESYKKHNLEIKTELSFFDIKLGVKKSKLVEIYDASIELEIIDDEIISEETFINVLSKNPTTTSDEVIIFKCNNQLAVHFIKCIQPLFNNLTVSQIHKSKSLLNKNRKVLNQADLYNANKRVRQKSSFQKDKITNYISRILES